MKKLNKQDEIRSVWRQILTWFLRIIGTIFLIYLLLLSSFFSILLIYNNAVDTFFSDAMLPTYPDSIQLKDGEHIYSGNCCVAKVWNYCTSVDLDTLINHFEPFLGTSESDIIHGQTRYETTVIDESFLMQILTSLLNYGNPSLTLTIIEDFEGCSGAWYQLRTRYYSE